MNPFMLKKRLASVRPVPPLYERTSATEPPEPQEPVLAFCVVEISIQIPEAGKPQFSVLAMHTIRICICLRSS